MTEKDHNRHRVVPPDYKNTIFEHFFSRLRDVDDVGTTEYFALFDMISSIIDSGVFDHDTRDEITERIIDSLGEVIEEAQAIQKALDPNEARQIPKPYPIEDNRIRCNICNDETIGYYTDKAGNVVRLCPACVGAFEEGQRNALAIVYPLAPF